jgi:hypothetical protein
MGAQDLPIWERALVESEWRSLIADADFMARLLAGIESLAGDLVTDGLLLLENWPKEAHEALLALLPERLAGAFDLSVFRADGSRPFLDETEGLRILRVNVIAGPAGFDESQLLPCGSEMPLGPYADIADLERVPLPIRLERSYAGFAARVRVVPEGDDLLLIVEQYGCGRARKLDNGSFCVEETASTGTMPLAEAESLDVAADLLMEAGRRHVLALAPWLHQVREQ